MATFKKMFVTSKALEREGVWHELGAGVKIKVARMGTMEYNATLRKLAQPHKGLAKRVVDGDEAMLSESDLQVFKDIEAQTLAKHVLVDWSGFTEGDEPNSPAVEYSEEQALEYIKGSDDFRKMVMDLASKASNFKDAEGN